ncbi:MAG: hypothetical protein HRT41_02275 [Campylobacteraceae bacterium]|nr:hypothetical protein [Campylobacteraceae bacterium]
MTFQEQMEEDLKVCFNENEFALPAVHTLGNIEEPFNVLFDAEVEVIFNHDQYEGVASMVPMITVQMIHSLNITNESNFLIDGINYEVVYKEPGNEIMKIYLGIIQ